jgi:hypothetical protein
MTDTAAPRFSERAPPAREVRELLALAQRAMMQFGRGAVLTFEGVPGQRYLTASQLGAAPLGPEQRALLADLIATYDPAWEVVLLRQDADGQGRSMAIFRLPNIAPPRRVSTGEAAAEREDPRCR